MSRLLLGCLLLAAGCKADDGETLRKAARKTGEKVEAASAPAQALTTGLRASLGEGSVPARVEARLRWDHYLSGERIGVRGDGRGGVTLSGTVSDESARQRALDLAGSTAGVENVVDEMEVQ